MGRGALDPPAFSPEEKYLYVGDWDDKKKVVMRYEVQRDGRLLNGQVFFDMTSTPGEDAIDGIKVDEKGDPYVSGAGGLGVVSPAGKHLGESWHPGTCTTSLGAIATARRSIFVPAARSTA